MENIQNMATIDCSGRPNVQCTSKMNVRFECILDGIDTVLHSSISPKALLILYDDLHLFLKSDFCLKSDVLIWSDPPEETCKKQTKLMNHSCHWSEAISSSTLCYILTLTKSLSKAVLSLLYDLTGPASSKINRLINLQNINPKLFLINAFSRSSRGKSKWFPQRREKSNPLEMSQTMSTTKYAWCNWCQLWRKLGSVGIGYMFSTNKMFKTFVFI